MSKSWVPFGKPEMSKEEFRHGPRQLDQPSPDSTPPPQLSSLCPDATVSEAVKFWQQLRVLAPGLEQDFVQLLLRLQPVHPDQQSVSFFLQVQHEYHAKTLDSAAVESAPQPAGPSTLPSHDSAKEE